MTQALQTEQCGNGNGAVAQGKAIATRAAKTGNLKASLQKWTAGAKARGVPKKRQVKARRVAREEYFAKRSKKLAAEGKNLSPAEMKTAYKQLIKQAEKDGQTKQSSKSSRKRSSATTKPKTGSEDKLQELFKKADTIAAKSGTKTPKKVQDELDKIKREVNSSAKQRTPQKKSDMKEEVQNLQAAMKATDKVIAESGKGMKKKTKSTTSSK